MVRLHIDNITSLFKNCGLDKKYEVIKNALTVYGYYFLYKTEKYTTYQKNGRRLINLCKKFRPVKNDDDELQAYISQICLRELAPFKIYYSNDLNSFEMTKYTADFCGMPITKVLEVFNMCNMKNDLYYYGNNNKINEALTKIFDTYLIIHLAKIFSYFELTIETGCTMAIDDNFCYEIQMINVKITKCLKNNKNITVYTNNPDGKFMSKFKSFDCDTTENFINKLFIRKQFVYNFFASRTGDEIRELCTKNNDFACLIGRYFTVKKNITKDFICRIIITTELVYLCNLITNLDQQFINNNKPIDGLKLPTNKRLNRNLVIEV